MKRFAIFGGQEFYARGGFNDLIGTEDTLGEALYQASELINKHTKDDKSIEWTQIVDLTTGEIQDSFGNPLGSEKDAAGKYHLEFIAGKLQQTNPHPYWETSD